MKIVAITKCEALSCYFETSADIWSWLNGHQLQDISEAASLPRRVRMGDQPHSDRASSAWWRRPQRYPYLELCFPAHARGFGFIWKTYKEFSRLFPNS